ncbi:MAG: hypothetical protein ACJ72A_06235 [Nocardioidaceae bacterium]
MTTATVIDGGLSAVADGLHAAGVLCPGRKEPVDLVVARADAAERALSVKARSYLLLGRVDPRIVRRSGLVASQLLVLGTSDRPASVLPLGSADSAHYYLSRMAAPVEPSRRLRNAGATALLRGGLPVSRFVGGSRVATVLGLPSDRGRLPHLVSVACGADAHRSARVSWVLALGRGDDLQRAVFHVLDQGRLRWVVKFSRVRGAVDAFDRDAIGLGLAHSAGEPVAAHAPSLLARLDADGLPGSVETAAAGRPLVERLARRPRPLIDSIARWVVEMGMATAAPPERLEPERRRLSTDVLPTWVARGATTDLLARLPPVPGVLQHNDLGSWNILTDGRDFTAVDWESARAVGMPLWDLLYFLADALVRMEGPADVEVMERRCLALFRGGSPYSSTLFGWVRLAVAGLSIPPEAVGRLATLCWMHHGLSATLRESALGGAQPAPLGHLARLAAPWLADRALGPTWSQWTSG